MKSSLDRTVYHKAIISRVVFDSMTSELNLFSSTRLVVVLLFASLCFVSFVWIKKAKQKPATSEHFLFPVRGAENRTIRKMRPLPLNIMIIEDGCFWSASVVWMASGESPRTRGREREVFEDFLFLDSLCESGTSIRVICQRTSVSSLAKRAVDVFSWQERFVILCGQYHCRGVTNNLNE